MARTKAARSTSGARKSASTSKSSGARRSSKESAQSDRSSEDLSFARAKNFVEENANLQTAGIALAGAGLLALVSTVAGRSLMRTAATTVAKLATDNFGEYFGSADSDSESDRQTPSRQRDQARN